MARWISQQTLSQYSPGHLLVLLVKWSICICAMGPYVCISVCVNLLCWFSHDFLIKRKMIETMRYFTLNEPTSKIIMQIQPGTVTLADHQINIIKWKIKYWICLCLWALWTNWMDRMQKTNGVKSRVDAKKNVFFYYFSVGILYANRTHPNWTVVYLLQVMGLCVRC